MAIAHVCVQCGWDLARVRPRREPHYGLNIVRCPKCEHACVRRKHPLDAGWRRFRRADFALTLLFLRFIGVASMTFFCVVGGVFALVLFNEPQPMSVHMQNEARLFVVVFYLTIPLVLGTFLSAAFAHAALWKVWLVWLLWMGCVLFIVSLHGPMDSQFDPRYGLLESGETMAHITLGIWHIMLPAWLASGVVLIVALPGVILGRLLLRLRDTLLSAKWRWRHRRLKLARSANV